MPVQVPVPGKVVEDGPRAWAPAPMWETRKNHLAPGFRSAQIQPLQPLEE